MTAEDYILCYPTRTIIILLFFFYVGHFNCCHLKIYKHCYYTWWLSINVYVMHKLGIVGWKYSIISRLLVLIVEPSSPSSCISLHCLLDYLLSRSFLRAVDSVSLYHLWVKKATLFYLLLYSFDLSCVWTSSPLVNYTSTDCRDLAISYQATEGKLGLCLLTLIYKNLSVDGFKHYYIYYFCDRHSFFFT